MPEITDYLTISRWDEDRTNQSTPRVTPAHVSFQLTAIDGSIESDYLMTYVEGGNASFIFTETVSAKNFAGKKGSFIAQGKGTYDASTHAVKGTFTIVEGTGTGELQDVKGTGAIDSAAKDNPGKTRYTCVLADE
ncbi:hypothetical protein MMC24_001586 [Lignoscripta atroalba]|nr:hypothetical protein [Lignoscripta atroalba]